ncbi:MAG: hypothetical protein Q7V43_06880 [Myxococcales bacterium]|nr:hypothetical protein [Myxococcales bacterium]
MSCPPNSARLARAVAARPARRVTRRWTDEETAFLRKHYKRRGHLWCAKRLKRTACAVRQYALRCGAAPANWSPEEVLVLTRGWGELSERKLREQLPGRAWSAIAAKATALKLPPPNRGRTALKVAADRAGVNQRTLLRILRAEGVAVTRWVRGTSRRARRTYCWRTVDLDAAMAAVRRWDNRRASRLTKTEALARYRVSSHTLDAALALLAATRPVEGLAARGRAARLRPEDVEEALRLAREGTASSPAEVRPAGRGRPADPTRRTRYVAALADADGCISTAARALGVSPQAVRQFFADHPEARPDVPVLPRGARPGVPHAPRRAA